MPLTKEQRIENLRKARETVAANRAARKAENAGLAAGAPMDAPISRMPDPQIQADRDEVNRARSTPMRAAAGRVQVRGRDGEILRRGAFETHDQFEIPKSMVPEGWDYQWNVISVIGNTEITANVQHQMHQQGWRPVPAERYAGTLLPPNAKGIIIRDGLRLDERPLALSQEAREEELAKAHRLISDRNESLKLGAVKKSMVSGFEMGGKYRGTGGDIRMSIDKGLDIPQPKYDLADPD